MHYAVYNAQSGKILRYGFCAPEDAQHQVVTPGEECVHAAEDGPWKDTDWYFSEGEPTLRPSFGTNPVYNISLGQVLLINLPVGTSVAIDGDEPTVLPDGVLELSGDTPAVYEIEIIKWPYKNTSFQVTVHEA